MRKILVGSLACALMMAVPATALADDHSVVGDGSGDDAACATVFTTPCDTIQAAVNAADAGDVINIGPGTYSELVHVNESVALVGPLAGSDARDENTAVTTNEAVVGNANGALALEANDIVVDGLTIAGQTSGQLNGGGAYVVKTTSGHTIVNNVFRDNIFGLYLNNASAGVTTVRHNLFANNNNAGPSSGNGIYGDQSTNNVAIDQNRFVDNDIAFDTFLSPNSDIDITDNVLDGGGIALFQTNGATVSGNQVLDSPGSGVYLGGGVSNTDVLGNTVDNASGAAVRLANWYTANQNVSVVGNQLTNSQYGVRLFHDGAPDDVFDGTLELHSNRIYGNDVTGVSNADDDADVNAEHNWWGCNEGPADASCDGFTGDVDAGPWLTLDLLASPTTLLTGGEDAELVARLNRDSDGAPVNLGDFPATEVALTSSLGSVGQDGATTAGVLNGTLTSGATAGMANVTAALDGENVTRQVTINAPTNNTPAGNTPPNNTPKDEGTKEEAKFSGNALTLSSSLGTLTFNVNCPTGHQGSCSGTGTVQTVQAFASAKRKVTVAKGKFKVAPGKTGKVKLKLTRAGKKLLRERGSLKVRVTLVSADGTRVVKRFTLRAPRKKR